MVEVLHAFNTVLNDDLATVKKYIYNEFGLINYIKYYSVLSGDFKSFNSNNVDIVELNRMTEKYDWIRE